MVPARLTEDVEGHQPQWLVAREQVVVGPVSTELLLKGVRNNKIPLDAWVRQPNWSEWRTLEQIRETASLFRGEQRRLPEKLVCFAQDQREILLFALTAACSRTLAVAGVIHASQPGQSMVATYIQGLEADGILGQPLSGHDPVLMIAKAGRALSGKPQAGYAERAIAARLGSPSSWRGVMMTPFLVDQQLVAMLELGRKDHSFRAQDRETMEAIAEDVAVRWQQLRQ
jgi:GAF domain-containing protein